MNIPKIDNRDAKDILQEVKTLAKQYVPEWQFDENDPDFGVVFSQIFASMFETTLSRYNTMPYNHYISFLNLLGAKLLPAISSTGMITVSVVPKSKGAYIEKGKELYAAADNEEGRVFFETLDSMYAIDANITSVFATDDKKDSIVKVYDAEEEAGPLKPFPVFEHDKYENLQSHEIYFKNDYLFDTNGKSDFIIKFRDSRSKSNDERLSSIFFDKDNVVWQYFKEDAWRDIRDVQQCENGVRLIFDDSDDMCEVMNDKARFLRCVFKKIPEKPLHMTDVTCAAQSSNLSADTMLFDTSELSQNDFFPFGEQYNIYSDFYISSKEAFVKKGAKIDINIELQFIKVKINTENTSDNIKYKYLMTDMDFQSPDPVDIEIEKVVWEYWNGVGWAKLYPDDSNEDFFLAKSGETITKTLSFTCPENIENIVMGPADNYFIRARITKVKNQFNVLGNYVTPYIHNVSIDYSYPDGGRNLNTLLVRSNMNERTIKISKDEVTPLLEKVLCKYPTMYFCLDRPIEQSPVRVLFDIEAGLFFDNPSVRWEYYAKNKQGEYEWQNIEVMDATQNFAHSAVVTFIGKNNFAKTKLFQKEGYFLRICNHDNRYSDDKSVKKHPVINGIHFNTARIIQKQSHVPEYFFMNNGEENKTCQLSSKNISEAKVWVNEFGSLSTNEQEKILSSKEDLAEIEYDDKGRVSQIWVQWHQVPSVACAKPAERAFEIDYNKGKIIFGNGKYGKIPTHQKKESIKIEYSMSEGTVGNIGAYEISGFTSAIPYIESVTNLKPLLGGIDMETVENSAKRMSGRISGMNRIVSLDDFESSICHNDRNIYKVKCIPHVNEMSQEEVGTISVAVLPKDYMQGYEKFLVIKERIEDFIKSRASLTLVNASKIQVFEVRYVEISVHLDVVISDYNLYQTVYQRVYNKLKEFLDPINGNFAGEGWRIGELPRKELIYNYVKVTKDIKWIKGINVFAKVVTLEGKKEVDFDEIKKQHFTVPVFGEPEINMSVD